MHVRSIRNTSRDTCREGTNTMYSLCTAYTYCHDVKEEEDSGNVENRMQYTVFAVFLEGRGGG